LDVVEAVHRLAVHLIEIAEVVVEEEGAPGADGGLLARLALEDVAEEVGALALRRQDELAGPRHRGQVRDARPVRLLVLVLVLVLLAASGGREAAGLAGPGGRPRLLPSGPVADDATIDRPLVEDADGAGRGLLLGPTGGGQGDEGGEQQGGRPPTPEA